jgi:colanic acid/amylovoran biosynthesis glycosyltransferase
MRICLVTGRYPVVTETFVADSAVALRRCGHEVRLVARRRARRSGEPLPDLHAAIAGRWFARVADLLRHPRRWAVDAARARRVTAARFASIWDAPYRARLDVVSSADCLLAHFGYVAVDWLPVALLAGRPFAAYFHGSDITRWQRRSPHFYDHLFASGAGLLTNSEFLRGCLVDAGASPDRVRVVPLAAHEVFATLPMPPPLDHPRIITISRLVEKKGVDDALASFAEASRVIGPEWRYLVVGDGPERGRLRRLARRLGVGDRVDFVPRATRSDIVRLLNASSIFLQGSRTASNGDTEGTPIALLEAATLGLPIVATSHAGIPEMLPPGAATSGCLVGERDVAAMSAALVRLAGSVQGRRDWGRACMACARQRTPAREGRELSEALRAVAAVPA